ncbi:MAG: dihydrofolate reductase [Alphaproteobacteria bacterium]|nr:dihydrofolate reductase [Alphaproteobacteria bacterium]MDE2041470.1 dihydrofolate reductase [Alphaproteobacteria bacterium]MDE2340949.1 dihydrofolate reductase [Alphaproteobacteria bacterium]
MSTPEIVLILARAQNGVIGVDGKLPWHIPGDLKRFKALTLGAPMIMGRKTFETLPGKLPGRRHVVLTRDADWSAAGADVAHTVAVALALAGDVPRISVVGGAEIYALFIPHASRIELTEVHIDAQGDTIVPPFGPEWRTGVRVDHPAHGATPAFSFITLVRA